MDSKLSAVLQAIWKYAQEVPELMAFLTANKDAAIAIVKDLANTAFKGKPLSEWKSAAIARLQALGIQGKEEYLHILADLAYEVYKAESEKSWWKKLFSWIPKVKDWLVRNGLETYVNTVMQSAISFVVSEFKKPGVTAKSLYEAAFAFVKASVPNSKDTWIAIISKVAISIAEARFGVKLP